MMVVIYFQVSFKWISFLKRGTNFVFFLLNRASELNSVCPAERWEDSSSHTQSSCSTLQTFQLSFRPLSFRTFTSSLRSSPESSEETSLLVSLASGRTMIWLAIRHQLADLLTTSVLHKASMIFRRIPFMPLSTLSSCWPPALSSQEFGSMFLDPAQGTSLDSSWIRNSWLKVRERTLWWSTWTDTSLSLLPSVAVV